MCIANGRPSHCFITSSFNFNLYFWSASNFPLNCHMCSMDVNGGYMWYKLWGPTIILTLLCGGVGLWWWRAYHHYHHHLQASTFHLTWNTSRCWCPRCRSTPSNNQSIEVVSSGREVSNGDFQCRGRELGRGDGREGCWFVTAANGSCLGVAGHGASLVGKAVDRQLLRGKEGGFAVCNFDFHYIPSKTASFWYCLKKKLIWLNQLVRRKPVGSSGSPVGPSVQAVWPQFNTIPI